MLFEVFWRLAAWGALAVGWASIAGWIHLPHLDAESVARTSWFIGALLFFAFADIERLKRKNRNG